MTDMDLRGGGHVDFAYNFFPWASDLPLGEVDMKRIPGRVLFWMSTLHCDPNLERLLNPDYLNKDGHVMSCQSVQEMLRMWFRSGVRLNYV